MVEFLGRIVGKALYEGILLEYPLALFVSKLMGRYCFLDELADLDPELYRNLMFLKVHPPLPFHATSCSSRCSLGCHGQ